MMERKEILRKIIFAVRESDQTFEFIPQTGKAVFIRFKFPEVIMLPGVYKFYDEKGYLDEQNPQNRKLLEVIEEIKKVRAMPDEVIVDGGGMAVSYNKAIKLVEIMEKYGVELYEDAKKVLRALELQEREAGIIVPAEMHIRIVFDNFEDDFNF
jgi:hypothetical protein